MTCQRPPRQITSFLISFMSRGLLHFVPRVRTLATLFWGRCRRRREIQRASGLFQDFQENMENSKNTKNEETRWEMRQDATGSREVVSGRPSSSQESKNCWTRARALVTSLLGIYALHSFVKHVCWNALKFKVFHLSYLSLKVLLGFLFRSFWSTACNGTQCPRVRLALAAHWGTPAAVLLKSKGVWSLVWEP